MNSSPNRTRRVVLILSGLTDALIGAIILLIGFDLVPLDISAYGIPQWLALAVGGFMFIIGAWVAAYNYSRLEE